MPLQNPAPSPVAAPGETPQPQVVHIQNAVSPAAAYEGLRAQQRVLRGQLSELEGTRRSISGRLQNESVQGADRAGLEARLARVDQRIADTERLLTQNALDLARASAIPGAVVPPPPPPVRRGPSDEVVALSALFTLAVLMPLSIAWARRLWKRGSAMPPVPPELTERLSRIEQAVDAIAVEVERVGEGQRYVSGLMAEQGRMLGAGAAEPIALDARERVAVRRE